MFVLCQSNDVLTNRGQMGKKGDHSSLYHMIMCCLGSIMERETSSLIIMCFAERRDEALNLCVRKCCIPCDVVFRSSPPPVTTYSYNRAEYENEIRTTEYSVF